MKIALKVLVIASLSALPVQARDLLGDGCFLREYTADHLRRHPVQQVTRIALRRAPEQGLDGAVLVDLALNLRAWSETLRATAVCVPLRETLDCLMDGDAGAFTLGPGRDGALRLAVAPRGMAFEGAADFALIAGDRGDDRLFLIPPAPAAACR